MDDSKTTKVISILLVFFLLVTVISQIYIKVNQPVKTEVAMRYSTTESLLFKGVYIRNEHTVPYSTSGIISYTHEDGSKLAKNSVIAKVYKTDSDLEIKQQIEDINKRISQLTDAQSLVGTDSSQLEAFNTQISEKHAAIVKIIDNENYSEIKNLKYEYLNLQCKKDIVKGISTGFDDKITALKSQITALEAKISKQPTDVTVDETGYFVSITDGYENSINYETAQNLSQEDIDSIIKAPVKETESNVIGKIVDDYKWRFVGVLDADDTLMVMEGKTVELRVGSDSKTISATVVSVSKGDNGKNTIIFECDQLSADFVESRVAQFRLLLDDYNGIRISADAIRFDAEQNAGVFIKSGVEVLFKKINVVYSSDDFVIAQDTTGEDGYISLYDNVIIEGKDLYDGKIIS